MQLVCQMGKGEGSLKVYAELDFHGIPAAKVAAGVVPTELLLICSQVAVDCCPDNIEDV